MKNFLEEFRSVLENKYLFHLHTSYTDGSSTVNDYCLYANKNSYSSIIFTEHVRKRLSYSFKSLYTEIANARADFKDLKIYLGVEAKVLLGGELDIPSEILSNIEVVCFSIHSFPQDSTILKKSLEKLFANEKWRHFIRVWCHPSSTLKILGSSKSAIKDLNELIISASKNGIYIEYNMDYDKYYKSLFDSVLKEKIIIGVNGHNVNDVVEKLK